MFNEQLFQTQNNVNVRLLSFFDTEPPSVDVAC